MKVWRFVKTKFNGTDHQAALQQEIANLAAQSLSLIQAEQYPEARKLLFQILERENEIENPAFLDWTLGCVFTI
jgi:hypothetical protein